MPLFICRWQNGDFSAVSASSREEAMELLDEVGNADVADLFTAKRFMVHSQLNNDPDAAELQKHLDVPRPMAEQAVKERRRRAIVEMPYPSDEVQ
jgi:hypothetical protein